MGKREDVAALKEVFDLANELKKLDREKYGELFAWINRSVKARMPVEKIGKAVKILHSRAQGYDMRPRDLHQYMNGIVRSLDGEKAAAELRAGQRNFISDILGRAMAAAMEEKREGGKKA